MYQSNQESNLLKKAAPVNVETQNLFSCKLLVMFIIGGVRNFPSLEALSLTYQLSGGFTPFQPSVVFQLETSHLIWSADQMNGFYIKCNRLKWIKGTDVAQNFQIDFPD